ncbi:MAG: hypothetical protein M0D54_20035 [Hyphomonadaceae bacterium JAD_PAG50586_4]|nr:MAG: hypothetical protein M0D54_20035 [Hyphomonadaceae bacterium JAD_PAG50586_4]
MSPFEYLLTFAAIVLGLAITDLAMGLSRLLHAGSRVTWGLLTPLAAIVVFLKIVSQWWTWYAAQSMAQAASFEMFIVVMIGAVLLFLLAAALLPEVRAGTDRIDLPAHFIHVQRRFWLLFVAHWVTMNGVSIWAEMHLQGARLDLMSPTYLIPIAALALAFIKLRWLQTVSMAILIVIYLMQFHGQQLTAP